MRNVIRVAFPACRRVRRSKHAVVMCIGVILLVYLILANDVFPEYNHVRADSVVVMKMDEAVTLSDQGINFEALPEAAPRSSPQSRASIPDLQASVHSSSASKTASLFSLSPRASASVPSKDTATFSSRGKKSQLNGSYNNNNSSSNNNNGNNNSNNNRNNKNGVSEGSHNHIDAKLDQNVAQRESSKGDDSVVVRTEQTGSLGGSKGNNAQEQPRSESGLPLTGKGEDSSSSVLLAGVPRKHKVYLTIGMVTVKREKADYFFTTVASLLDHSSQAEQREITIVVMLADRNQDHNQLVLRQIQERYQRELQSGLILVIRGPNTDFIFEKNDVKRTYQDSLQRVQWRSKQNMDYAAVIEFSIPLSAFYLHIEDDVVSADSYFRHIRDFIRANEKKLWAMLEVCPHGFIGKLFKNADLPKLVMILRAFYLEQPCDFLIGYFTKMMTQTKQIIRPGALFFHQGKFSTLFNVTRKTDKLPGQGPKSLVAKVIRKMGNPAAEVFSDFEVYENHVIDYAYNLQTNNFLWTLDLKEGQRYTVVFTAAQRLKQLVIETGFSSENPRDRLHHANIEMGTEPPDSEGSLVCPGAKAAGTFENGRVEVKLVPAHNIRCFSVVVKATQKEWMVMREIIVTTE